MEEQINFHFPILTLKSVSPLLRKDGKVFAFELETKTANGRTIILYENKGLDLRAYIDKEMECLLEITRGHFVYKNDDNSKPETTLVSQYQWQKRLYEYFPELMNIHSAIDNASPKDEPFVQEQFEITANKFFKEWGLNGLDIGIYQTKPLFSSSEGFFLLNEYQFEEELEELELGEEVYIKIDEVFLRGIRPCKPLGEIKNEPGQSQAALQQKLNEEPKVPKKRKLFFD